jgi:hypothetical protein
MSTVLELLEGQIDATTANRVCWGSCSMLVATMLYFQELKPELQLPSRPGCARHRTHWNHMFLPRLPTTIMIARESSSGGSLRS